MGRSWDWIPGFEEDRDRVRVAYRPSSSLGHLACLMPTNLSSLLVVQTDSFSLSFQSQN